MIFYFERLPALSLIRFEFCRKVELATKEHEIFKSIRVLRVFIRG